MDREALVQALRRAAEQAAQPIPVPMGSLGTLHVRPMTVAEFESRTGAPPEGAPANSSNLTRAACRVLCDESGQRIFDEKNADDIALLASVPWGLLRRALEVADGTEQLGNG